MAESATDGYPKMIKTRNLTLALAATVVGLPIAYDSGKQPEWKKDADGKLATDSDGNPIMVGSDGAERSLGLDTVSRLNGEAKSHRERAEAAEKALRPFEGLDATAARKALDTVSKLDQKQLIDAGEVDRVRSEISKNFETQISDLTKRAETAESNITGMRVKSAFESSKYIKDQIAVPADMMRSTFASSFKDENGTLVPYGADGNKLFSKKRAGEVADFDEALEILVGGYAYRDNILKGGNHNGSGNNGNGGNGGGTRTVRRADFDAMEPAQKASTAAAAGRGELSIAD